MTTTICDRCGAPTNEKYVGDDGSEPIMRLNYATYDLCTQCMDQVKKFVLQHKKESEKKW